MRRALLFFLILGNAAVALIFLLPWQASANPVHGAWCTEEEMMLIDEQGVGFNEHTLCTTQTPVALDGTDTWTGGIICNNVYVLSVNDDGTVETHEMPLPDLTDMTLHLVGEGELNVIRGEGDLVIPFARCDF